MVDRRAGAGLLEDLDYGLVEAGNEVVAVLVGGQVGAALLRGLAGLGQPGPGLLVGRPGVAQPAFGVLSYGTEFDHHGRRSGGQQGQAVQGFLAAGGLLLLLLLLPAQGTLGRRGPAVPGGVQFPGHGLVDRGAVGRRGRAEDFAHGGPGVVFGYGGQP